MSRQPLVAPSSGVVIKVMHTLMHKGSLSYLAIPIFRTSARSTSFTDVRIVCALLWALGSMYVSIRAPQGARFVRTDPHVLVVTLTVLTVPHVRHYRPVSPSLGLSFKFPSVSCPCRNAFSSLVLQLSILISMILERLSLALSAAAACLGWVLSLSCMSACGGPSSVCRGGTKV